MTLEVKDLFFKYDKKEILKGIELRLEKSQVFCILGPNGCGKTTLLDCILGINTPEKGEIIVNLENINTLNAVELSKKIAYVPQKHNRTFPYTVLEVVVMGRTAHMSMFSSPGKKDFEIAEESLKKVGIYDFKDRIFSKLSSGEAQLVKIARALAQETKIIVLDEPTSHLDFKHELNVLKHIINLVKNDDISIIMSTHFPNHAFYVENSGVNTMVGMMEDGKFGIVGKPRDVLNEKNMKEIFKVETKLLEYIKENNKYNYIVPIEVQI